MKDQQLNRIANEIQQLRWTIISEMEESQLRFHLKDVANECYEIKESLQELTSVLSVLTDFLTKEA